MTGCTPCDLGLQHCHAPILEHGDGTYECLDGCGGPRAIHDDVLVAEPLARPAAEPRRPPARLAPAA